MLNQDQGASIFKDMQMYLIIIALGLVVLTVSLLLMVIAKFRKKIQEKLVAFRDKFMWNGYIRAVLISFIEQCMTVGIQIRLWLKESPE